MPCPETITGFAGPEILAYAGRAVAAPAAAPGGVARTGRSRMTG